MGNARLFLEDKAAHHHIAPEICAFLGCCTAYGGNPYRHCGATYRYHLKGTKKKKKKGPGEECMELYLKRHMV
jgi:hypothetical protein